MKDKYLEKMAEWNENFFKNYKKMEKKITVQLERKGQEYFILNDCYQLLGRFESTVKIYCEICEKLGKNEGNLIQQYLHLNDMPNVEKQFSFIENSENPQIYKDFSKYQDSGEVLQSKYVIIKYDKRVEKIASWVFEQATKIDKFISKEWKGFLPPAIRVILMDHVGPALYNKDLNETYLPVKGMKKEAILEITGDIVHETFHLVNSEVFKRTKFGYDEAINSFKLFDEGYAQFIQLKFMNVEDDTKKRIDYYSRDVAVKGTFDFYDLKDKWFKFINDKSVNSYTLAMSFAFFLEDKFGHEKFKQLFFPLEEVEESSWLEYVENYFGNKIDDLINEWKKGLIENKDLVEEVESVDPSEMCMNCEKYNYPIDKLDCTLNRFRQKNKEKFECSRFEKEVNTIVIYRSKSGFVRKYAEWIAEELTADLVEYSKASINDLDKYKTIIYGGGLYISGINGLKLITDNFDQFEDKKIVVFATGASAGRPEDINNIMRKNFSYDQLKLIKFFYLRGGFDFNKLKFPYTFLMRLMRWKLGRQKILTADEQGMLDSFEEPTDFTSKDNIRELVDECRK